MHRALFALLLLASAATAQNAPASVGEGGFICGLSEVQPELIGGLDSLFARVVYPEAARRDSVEGMVVVQFVVTEVGQVEDAGVIRSPDERLDEAALAAVRASRFTPGAFRGEPHRVRFAVPVWFRLGGTARSEAALTRCEQQSAPLYDTPPELLGGLDALQERLVYPEAAQREGVEGQVVVQFVVSELGAAREFVVLRSPDARLSEAALDAVRLSEFIPATRCRQAVALHFAVPVVFHLGDAASGDR